MTSNNSNNENGDGESDIIDNIQPVYRPNCNLLAHVKHLQQGDLSNLSYSRIVTTRRSSHLVLNNYRDVERKHVNGVNTLDLDPVESRYLLSGGSDGGVAIHDMQNSKAFTKHTCPIVHYKRRTRTFREGGHTHSVETVQWYPLDSGVFTTSSYDKSVKVWDTNTMMVADCYLMSEVIYCHHMSPRNLIAVGSKEPKVYLIDLKSGSKSHTLRAHTGKVMSVEWSPRRDTLLVTASSDQHIYMWDVRSARGPLINFDRFNSPRDKDTAARNKAHSAPVTGLRHTADGLHFISFGCDFRVRLWDAVTGLNTNVNYGSVINYSKRKLQFAVTSNLHSDFMYIPTQQVISVYNVFTGEKLKSRLTGHLNDVNCAIFDQSEQELYSGGNDRNILIWSYEGEGERGESGRTLRRPRAASTLIETYRDEWSDEEEGAEVRVPADVINGETQPDNSQTMATYTE